MSDDLEGDMQILQTLKEGGPQTPSFTYDMDAVGRHGRRVGKNGSLLQCGERSLRLFFISGLSRYLQCVT